MKARLGVITCDKCHQPMKQGARVMIVVEGNVTRSDDVLIIDGSCVYYASHFDSCEGLRVQETVWASAISRRGL